MLASEHRLRSADDFRHAVRRGRRSGGPVLTVHVATQGVDKSTNQPPQIGFVVSKAVGPAVVRNRVKRRLRHLMRARLGALPAGSLVVVRAQPAAGNAAYGELGEQLDRCLDRALDRGPAAPGGTN